jgi:multiple sugar transport system permease protein
MTRGGPGTTTESISVFIYNEGFRYSKISYVAAAAFIILILMLILMRYISRPLLKRV